MNNLETGDYAYLVPVLGNKSYKLVQKDIIKRSWTPNTVKATIKEKGLEEGQVFGLAWTVRGDLNIGVYRVTETAKEIVTIKEADYESVIPFR